MKLSVIGFVVVMLGISNLFMTFAWYGHLKDLVHKPWYIAALISWGIAFFEYLVQVPANRYGNAHDLQLGQLKILQEVVTLAIFVPFSIYYMQRPVSLNYLWAGLCMCGAVGLFHLPLLTEDGQLRRFERFRARSVIPAAS